MPKIRFLETRTVQDGTGTKFDAGKVYELPQDSCDRWLRRGVAEPVSDRAHHVEPGRFDPAGNRIGADPVEAARTAAAAAHQAKERGDEEEKARAAAALAGEEKAKAEAAAAEAGRIAALAAVAIPEVWADLPFADQRAIAIQLTEGAVKSKDDAAGAIQTEIKRRAAV